MLFLQMCQQHKGDKMRKLFSVLIAVLLLAGTAYAATPGYRRNPGTGDILGQGKYQSDAHKIFRMVRYVPVTYSGASTLEADSIVVWNLTSDDGVTVTTSTTSSDSAVAGIIVQQALTPDTDGNTAAQDAGQGNWTWLQTYGLSQCDLSADGAVASGAAMGTGTSAGAATAHTVSSKTTLSGTNDSRALGNAGFFFDAAAASATDVECFVNLD